MDPPTGRFSWVHVRDGVPDIALKCDCGEVVSLDEADDHLRDCGGEEGIDAPLWKSISTKIRGRRTSNDE